MDLKLVLRLTIPAIALGISGCHDQALEISERASERQAEQNRTMARLQQDVAAGTQELLTAEATARKDHLRQAQAVARERADLSKDLRRLETARAQLSDERRTDSLLAAALRSGGGLLVGIVTLAFAWLALFALRRDAAADPAVEVLLLEQMLDAAPQAPPADPRSSLPRLASTAAEDQAPGTEHDCLRQNLS